jgi:hypothetical protein
MRSYKSRASRSKIIGLHLDERAVPDRLDHTGISGWMTIAVEVALLLKNPHVKMSLPRAMCVS